MLHEPLPRMRFAAHCHGHRCGSAPSAALAAGFVLLFQAKSVTRDAPAASPVDRLRAGRRLAAAPAESLGMLGFQRFQGGFSGRRAVLTFGNVGVDSAKIVTQTPQNASIVCVPRSCRQADSCVQQVIKMTFSRLVGTFGKAAGSGKIHGVPRSAGPPRQCRRRFRSPSLNRFTWRVGPRKSPPRGMCAVMAARPIRRLNNYG